MKYALNTNEPTSFESSIFSSSSALNERSDKHSWFLKYND